MCNNKSCWQLLFFIFALCLTSLASAQSAEVENGVVENSSSEAPMAAQPDAKPPGTQEVSSAKSTSAVNTNKTVAPADKNATKMVQSATINLQTTVTGNQEQPRVLYILPWQSPAPEDVDFESFSNDQKMIFEHVEREELRRELEASGEE
ncbi:MAG: hypothetical protein V4660_06970 [Pseudomonadota bacterium]